MPRTHMRRALAALFASLAIAATAIPPIGGIAGAAQAPAVCPDGDGVVCELVISFSPSVVTGTPFTVQVLVTTNGTTPAKDDPCAATVEVRLSVQNLFDGPYSDTLVANAVAGVATFTVTIPSGSANDGPYSMYAFVDGEYYEEGCSGYDYIGDSADFTAVTIPENQPIAPCPEEVVCYRVTSGTGTAATLIADTGTFSNVEFETFVTGTGCEPAGPADPGGVLSFDYAGSDPKTIIIALKRELVTKGMGQFKVCWRSDTLFTQLGGTPAPLVGGLFTGFLPSCKKNDLGPCVLFQKSNQHNTGFFGILAPENDPKAYPK